MGAEISQTEFTNSDYVDFKSTLKKETLLLGQWLKSQYFCDKGYSFGAELESWIVNKNTRPSAKNNEIIEGLKHPQVVHELSKYNIEINSTAYDLSSDVFQKIHNNLTDIFSQCNSMAEKNQSQLMLVGTLPHLKLDEIGLSSMTPKNRFQALNNQLFNSQSHSKSEIYITGKDELRVSNTNIMAASATTSFQVHWKIPISKAVQSYNAAQVASSIVVALSANSPFLFGKELWEESRIPLFEHTISSSPFLTKNKFSGRTGFGSKYISDSVFSYFLENFLNHNVILPKSLTPELKNFTHLNLHNGTIWRWNRPIIGHNDDGTPHIRIEHRAQAAGPTLLDSTANMAFFIGLSHSLAKSGIPMEFQLPFVLAERNFYKAAKKGLSAKISWLSGEQKSIKDLIISDLLDQSAQGLRSLGIDEKDVELYIYDIIKNRVLTDQTGSQWQKNELNKNGKDFNKLCEKYISNQNSGEPVHKWK